MAQTPSPAKNWSTKDLAQSDLFKYNPNEVSLTERVEVAHARAKAIGLLFKPTIDDILHCSERFWEMHIDPINAIDGAAVALWTLQFNLSGGTIAPFVKKRPELKEIWERILNFEVTAHYMLSEVNHGLDAPNIETTATLLDDGSFDLHTPHDGAAKCMPASIPAANIPRIAVVMARLKIKNKDFGPRPFLVAINDGKEMCEGVTSRLLPNRSGSRPIGHAITHFKHVKLPRNSFLDDFPLPSFPSSRTTTTTTTTTTAATPPSKPLSPRLSFLTSIWRIGIGSTTLTSVIIPALRVHAYIVASYSSRRVITTPRGTKQPIISFRTQQRPILGAIAGAWVLEAFFRSIRKYYIDAWDFGVEGGKGGGRVKGLDIRNGVSTAFKVACVGVWREMNQGLMDRCGSQGLFEHNQLVAGDNEVRGVTVAEGDIQVLSIRLAAEVLLGRYEMPQPQPSANGEGQEEEEEESLLRKHELGLMDELRGIAGGIFAGTKGEGHRTDEFDKKVLPRALELVEAIGMRMAYDAALSSLSSLSSPSPSSPSSSSSSPSPSPDTQTQKLLLDLFEARAIQRELSWYVQAGLLTREAAYEKEDRAMRALMREGVWDGILRGLEESVGVYVYAGIGDEGKWKRFYDGLSVFEGNVKGERVLGKL